MRMSTESPPERIAPAFKTRPMPIPWEELKQLAERSADAEPIAAFSHPQRTLRNAYCWGVATSTDHPISDAWKELVRVAEGKRPRTSLGINWELAADDFVDRSLAGTQLVPFESAEAVLWAAVLPHLTEHVEGEVWWRVLDALLQLHEQTLENPQPTSRVHLMIGGELGLTLAGCLSELPLCTALRKPSSKAIRQWCEGDVESVANAILPLKDARLVLASLIRSQARLDAFKIKRVKAMSAVGESLVQWIAATTRTDGTSTFSTLDRNAVAEDIGANGLLMHASMFDPESLKPAIEAALGRTKSHGRLAWMVSLPESMHHEPDSKLVSMFCEWDVRRGKTVIDYSQEEMRLEVAAGKRMAVSGRVQTQIEIGGEEQRPSGEWSSVCEFSDDDVHYFELEQPWSGDITLQRQVLLFRDDRCLMFADAIVASEESSSDLEGPTSTSVSTATDRIHYACRIPLSDDMTVLADEDTRELYLCGKQRRVLVLPLAANEWKVGPSEASLRHTRDHHLISSATGVRQLYCPLWLDFSPRRFKRKRTWRTLTVAENLRIVKPYEAAAFRVQQGSEQWVIYRSLLGSACRTFLGKHLIADFYCSRFDPSDGIHEELVTVNDQSNDDE